MATNFTTSNISSIKIENVKYNLKSVPFHATEAEWLETSYIPKAAELIVYDQDQEHNYLRFKTGDGKTTVNALPFSLLTKEEVEKLIASAGHLKRIILKEDEELPTAEDDIDINAIYMLPSDEYNAFTDVYIEYMYVNGQWEIIGNTRVDLSNYLETITTGVGLKATKTDNPKQNAHIEIDTDVVFVFNCGSSTELID